MAPGDLLDDLRRVPSWMAAAACRGMQSAVFFPELGTGRPYAAQRACARLSRGGAVP